jgi:hypothetical protein
MAELIGQAFVLFVVVLILFGGAFGPVGVVIGNAGHGKISCSYP